ncbi:peptide-methionine (S)-S-oxide reductase MsrA [Furfurilactobacillus entadae]|uniref:peptide-methionine (S)-S-oxide reductase MsrA n=1 Tax=Furfurilactobacillus entadae TaxID=2922307 RepID=UPI0035E58256
MNEQDQINTLAKLILNPGTRAWEREQLVTTKQQIENGANVKASLATLESKLRPLAVRDNLTPDLADYYAELIHNQPQIAAYDFARHEAAVKDARYDVAVFAGGCFWCMVEPFETRPGIISVMSGYTGGHVDSPTYDQVISQTTGHVEAVQIVFDPKVMTYQALVGLFWQIIDPTDNAGQVNDRGEEYRPIIFVRNSAQRQVAEASKEQLIESKRYHRPIVTPIVNASTFWPAENYHQQFYLKQTKRYRMMERSRHQYFAWQRMKNWFSRHVSRP